MRNTAKAGIFENPPQQHDNSEIIHNNKSVRFNRGEFCCKGYSGFFKVGLTQKYLSGATPHTYLLSIQTTSLQTVWSCMKRNGMNEMCILHNAAFRVALLLHSVYICLCFHFGACKTVRYMRFQCIDICNLCSGLYRWLLLHQKSRVIITIIVRTTVKYCAFIRFRSVFYFLGPGSNKTHIVPCSSVPDK